MKFVKTQVQFLLLTNINIGTTLIIILARYNILLTLLRLYMYLSLPLVCVQVCVYSSVLAIK